MRSGLGPLRFLLKAQAHFLELRATQLCCPREFPPWPAAL